MLRWEASGAQRASSAKEREGRKKKRFGIDRLPFLARDFLWSYGVYFILFYFIPFYCLGKRMEKLVVSLRLPSCFRAQMPLRRFLSGRLAGVLGVRPYTYFGIFAVIGEWELPRGGFFVSDEGFGAGWLAVGCCRLGGWGGGFWDVFTRLLGP